MVMTQVVPRLIAAAVLALWANAALVSAETPFPLAANDQTSLRAELFRRFDVNRDHRFSDREVREMIAAMQREGRGETEAAREAALARFDHDGDGRLNAAERREKLHTQLADGAKADSPGYRAALARHDHNRNGTLDPKELLEIEAQLETRIAAQDSDGNGMLDAEEIQAARQAEQKARGRRLPATTEQEQRENNEDFWRIVEMQPDAAPSRHR